MSNTTLEQGSATIPAIKIGHSISKLSIEVIDCKHYLISEGKAFLLAINYQAHNSGNKNTTISEFEAHLVDEQNKLQTQTLTPNTSVRAGETTTPLTALFSFTPPFPYAQKIEIHFILNHTHGREVFVANSIQDQEKGGPREQKYV
jgi:hypothetical protein